MMKNKVSLFPFFILLLMPCSLLAKNERVKYGKISKKDLQATVCPIDKEAKAYYLFDKGESVFLYNNGFFIEYTRHFRLKILDESALNRSTFAFDIFIDADGRVEDVSGIRAQSYNLVDGQVHIAKLPIDGVQKESVNRYWDRVSISLPEVKVGSVVEVIYSFRTRQLFRLKGWQFQHDIPVLRSEYTVEIPAYFAYKQYPYHPSVFEMTQHSTFASISLSLDTDYDFSSEVLEYKAKDVKAYKALDAMSANEKNISRVEFELTKTDFPEAFQNFPSASMISQQHVLTKPSWLDVKTTLLKSREFGLRLKEVEALGSLAESIKAHYDADSTKASAALRTIKAHARWNGDDACFSFQRIDEILKSAQGNAADINLALVTLLRALDVEAYPVVLRTKDQGFLRSYFPCISQFNYVIAACRLNGKLVLFDATNNDSGCHQLSERCANGVGLIIDQDYLSWVNLE